MHPSKYQPLADHLAGLSVHEVTLTLPEIETIIGTPLPVTAYVDASYWNATAIGKAVPMRLLRARGWRARFDRTNLRVIFTRDAP